MGVGGSWRTLILCRFILRTPPHRARTKPCANHASARARFLESWRPLCWDYASCLRRSWLVVVVVVGLAAAVREVERDAAMGQAPELEWDPAVELGAELMGLAQVPGPTPTPSESSQTVRMK